MEIASAVFVVLLIAGVWATLATPKKRSDVELALPSSDDTHEPQDHDLPPGATKFYSGMRHRPPGRWVKAFGDVSITVAQPGLSDVEKWSVACERAEDMGRPYGVALELEPNNSDDPDAIKVIGWAEFGTEHNWHLGYVPRNRSARLHREFIGRGVALAAELVSIYQDAGGFIDIKINILQARQDALAMPEARLANLGARSKPRWAAHFAAGLLATIVGILWWNSGADDRRLAEADAWAKTPEGITARAESQTLTNAIAMAARAADRGGAEMGVPFHVPTDARADYRILFVERTADGYASVGSRRSGPSGVSYEQRLVNCRTREFAYVRSGDSLSEFNAASLRTPMWGPLTPGSISTYVANHACDQLRE